MSIAAKCTCGHNPYYCNDRGNCPTAIPLPNTLREDNESDVGREAKALVEKFNNHAHKSAKDDFYHAKACAIIHCDGMLEELWKTDETRLRVKRWTAIREAVENI